MYTFKVRRTLFESPEVWVKAMGVELAENEGEGGGLRKFLSLTARCPYHACGNSGGAADRFSADSMPFADAEKVIVYREDEKYFR